MAMKRTDTAQFKPGKAMLVMSVALLDLLILGRTPLQSYLCQHPQKMPKLGQYWKNSDFPHLPGYMYMSSP